MAHLTHYDGCAELHSLMEEVIVKYFDDWPVALGDVAKDRITGFEGVVVAVTQWLNACRRATLQPRTLKEGTVIPADSFDVEQLEIVERAAFTEKPEEKRTNGPMPTPKRGV